MESHIFEYNFRVLNFYHEVSETFVIVGKNSNIVIISVIMKMQSNRSLTTLHNAQVQFTLQRTCNQNFCPFSEIIKHNRPTCYTPTIFILC